MITKMCIHAPAKLNLHLRVFPKRADGYHNIESVFQQIDFCDELSINYEENHICTVNVHGAQLPKSNTVTKAYELFTEYTGIKTGVRVDLIKRIPSGAGMGGGSSDAAAMLKALNALFCANVPDFELRSLAQKIGSDVPFFIDGGAALVSGRGEKIKKIASRSLIFVLICPHIHSSTKEAYGLIDEWKHVQKEGPCFENLEKIYVKNPVEWEFINSFVAPLVQKYPIIGNALCDMQNEGAQFTTMTGSGSTVFGVFNTEAAAKTAAHNLSRTWNCYITKAME